MADAPHDHAPAGQPDIVRNRLPSLFEVLSRRTLSPVDLYSFYIYMRDQQRSVDYLDFWLDVAQHMTLCRHYVRELRRSVLIGTPDGERAASKRSSAILDSLGDMSHPVAGPSKYQTEKEKDQDAQMSAFLREDDPLPVSHSAGTGMSGLPASQSAGTGISGGTGATGATTTTGSRSGGRPSSGAFASTPPLPGLRDATDSSGSPLHTVKRQDIRASAEKILYTYLLPGAEREIILPGTITEDITTAIEEQGRDDPEVFDVAKDYVFQAMERDAFPGFLRMKALGNLIPPTLILRLIIGMVSMFGGFWAAFVLIFLDESRRTRLWLILPFTLGVYFLASFQYALDPVLALVGFSEYTPFSFYRVREPFVRRLLLKRAAMVLAVTVLIDAALLVLFILVPGRRL